MQRLVWGRERDGPAVVYRTAQLGDVSLFFPFLARQYMQVQEKRLIA